MPLVSIVIPTYNRAWILEEAIESVLAQTCRDFELIVVDDGSTDDTGDILARYPGIIVVKQENKGVSAARNAGVSIASGKYLAFLDSDDLWLPKKLEKQIRFFRENPSTLICQTGEIWIRKGVRVNPGKRHVKPSGMIFERSLELCLVSPSAVMMSRKLFDETGGFDENLPACEDYDLWLRITHKHPVHLIREALVIKRGGHEDQLSRSRGLDRYRIMSLIKIIESGALTKDQHESAVRALRRKCQIYANGCEKRGRIEEATHFYGLAEKYA